MKHLTTPPAHRYHFRAWHLAERRMIDRICWISLEHHTLCDADGSLVDFAKDAVLLQSTGRTDRNGREIFQGDILRGGLIVEYHESLRDSADWLVPGHWLGTQSPGSLEVIGNVYEHAKLLNEA